MGEHWSWGSAGTISDDENFNKSTDDDKKYIYVVYIQILNTQIMYIKLNHWNLGFVTSS